MLRKLYAWLLATVRERQTYDELRRLDDRMLRDIGLDRGQVSRY